MVTQLDLDKVVKSASLKTQSDQTLAMDVPAIKADVKSKLSKMRSVLGPTAQSRLFELKRGVLVSAAAPGSSCTLTLKLLNAPSPRDVKNRLLSHQKGGAELMLKNLDVRIAVPRTFELWRSVFGFSLMPTLPFLARQRGHPGQVGRQGLGRAHSGAVPQPGRHRDPESVVESEALREGEQGAVFGQGQGKAAHHRAR